MRPQRPRWLLPAAIAIGAILAIAGGAFVGLALTGTRDVAQGQPSPTPSVEATPSATASPSAEPSVEPTATPAPTSVALPVIPNRAIAAITVDAMEVWAEPDDASIQFGELGEGARLFIIGEPSEDDGQHWYRIAYVDGPKVSGFDLGECELGCGPSLGFVATPASGEEVWLEEVDVECPVSPLTTDQLLALLPLERLHCYGRSDITVSGTLDESAIPPNGAFTPEWLADNPPRSIGGGLGIHFAPDFEDDLPAPSTTVRLVGHFEDEAAATCRIDHTRVTDGPSTAMVVLTCRTAFVATDVEVLSAP